MNYRKNGTAYFIGGTMMLAAFATPALAESQGVSIGGSRNGGLGLGVSADLGGVKAGADASVGGSKGIAAGAAASVGGSRGINAGAGARVDNGIGAGLGASIGGSSGVNAGLGAAVGGGGIGVGAGANVGGSGGLGVGVGIGTGQPGGTTPGGGVIGGGTAPGATTPGTGTNPATPGVVAQRVANLSDVQRAKLKVRCREVASNASGYDASLVQLCKMLSGI
ncbi:hypothetical protein [Phyllobacterium endophyticum]|jgi:hypothetical protein|uniref:Uncharacterized protein n=1 Tax=Phyllobacterium endophyticum TaxID=1149773 RepID=A0A2P7AWI4_9HYPH|nr:hypothetical protein [Phyllobacterium endophyticum]MBB3235189.1 hypothetical protein [Phyllobacterium endophyticum]PSH58566.1 hypothetical protein CU100_13385 [Phyllobacterium endophyticum]TXR49028.1 hypothetical protein FVA77_12095 [Phyllobacterium endophyticum]TYR39249.1 hypothetical protein FY050_25215 [Phyllobacterium endophyticum]